MSTELIKEALQSLHPTALQIEDDSPAHAGHSGRGNGGHFKVTIVSDIFTGKSPVQRHQLVYKALGDLMKTHIHAVQIDAQTP